MGAFMDLFRRPQNPAGDHTYIPVVVDYEPTPEPEVTIAGRRFELAVSSRELAALYLLKGWQVAGARAPSSIPDSRELLAILLNLAESITNEPENTVGYNNSSRLMAVNDSDYPGVVDLYLYIGHTTETDIPLTAEPESEPA